MDSLTMQGSPSRGTLLSRSVPTPIRRVERGAPGHLIVKAALCTALASIQRKTAAEIIEERYVRSKDDERLGSILRSTIEGATTTQSGWLSQLVAADVVGWVASLAPRSAFAAIVSRGSYVEFGNSVSVSVPYRAGSPGEVGGAWIGEGGGIPVKRMTLASSPMMRYKLAVISTLTKELEYASTPRAEAIIRTALETDTSIVLDGYALDAEAEVPGIRPAGLLAGMTPVTAGTDIAEDLAALVEALTAANCGAAPVLLANPAQALRLQLLRPELFAPGALLEVVSSQNVPAGRLILVDAAQIATGLSLPEYDATEAAAVVMADAGATAPTHATDAADRTVVGDAEHVPPRGGIAIYDGAQRAAGKVAEAAVVVSMFQQWSMALRTVLPVSWAKCRAGCVQYVDVAW